MLMRFPANPRAFQPRVLLAIVMVGCLTGLLLTVRGQGATVSPVWFGASTSVASDSRNTARPGSAGKTNSGGLTQPDEPLATVLDPDGTVNLSSGLSGSFDVHGYQMKLTTQGAPQFVAAPQVAGDENWDARFGPQGADQAIYALAVIGSDLYAGGDFATAGGVAVNRIAKWDGTSWSPLGLGTNNRVAALAVSGSDLYVGGAFTTAGGITVNRIAKWDGVSWSALGSGVNGGVAALAVSGSDVYIGGDFTTAGGMVANHIAKWDGANWSALGTGTNGSVLALQLLAGDLYVGGVFAMAGGTTVNNIAKWDGASWSALGSGVNNLVSALAVSGADVYVGGDFTTAGGMAANHIAKWDGANWSALGTGTNNSVFALQLLAGDLYVGGNFATAGGVTVHTIAKWDGNAWSAVGGGTSNAVGSLAVTDTEVYVGGLFTTAGGVTVNNVAKWDGANWSALGLGADQLVSALAVSGNDLYVGGFFTTVAGVTVNHIAKWDGTKWSALGAGVNNSVRALAISGGDLYVGGDFTLIGGVTVNRIAKWNGANWSALGSGTSNTVRGLAVSGSDLYVGGLFMMAGGITVNSVAKWDGASWSALGSGVNSEVYAVAVSGSNLYVGGGFTTAGGVPANRIAKWNGASWSAFGDLNAAVLSLAAMDSDLYVGGFFTMAGGQPANRIAKWDGANWSALGSGLISAVGVDAYGEALVVSGSDLYVGGRFTSAGGVTANRVAKWDGTGWSALGSGTNGDVIALTLLGNNLYAGGSFTTAGGKPSYNFARYDLCPSAIISAHPADQTVCAGASVTFSVVATGVDLTYQWRKDTVDIQDATFSDYTIDTASASDSGSYDVVVSNACGGVISNAAALIVQAYNLDAMSKSFSAAGGNGAVSVTTDASCDWTAQSNVPWISITSGGSGPGDGTVTYSVAANSETFRRVGNITVADQVLVVDQGAAFLDIPPNHPFYNEIGKLSARGITSGCGNGNYCPNDLVTREQMAAFIVRAKGEFSPPVPMTQRFTDVPPQNVFYNFIDRLAELQITLGCTPDHLTYCPSDPVKREQMAAFLLRGVGEFNPPTPMTQRFNDVPPQSVFYNFIDRLAVLQITLGCTPDHLLYCPNDSVTRAQMAAFLVRAFNL